MFSLSSCFLLVLCFCFAWAGDVVREERRTRCVAHCVDYNYNATTSEGMYSCGETTCAPCAKPCWYIDRSLRKCKLRCNYTAPCSDACEFIQNMGEASTDSSLLPTPPGRPRLVEGTIKWDKDSYEFYKKKSQIRQSPKGVVFLLLGSKVVFYPNGSIDTDNLIWEFIGIRLVNQNVAVSEAQLILRFACGQSYLFKVAAFNEMGSNQYKISKPYTSEELLNKSCDASCPSNCSSLTQSQLDLHLVNPLVDHFSFYHWSSNKDCSHSRASRVIVWSRPSDIQQDEKFCYEVHVMRDPSLSDPGCSMDDQVYCFQSDSNQMVLRNLQPGCALSVAVYSGKLETSKLPQRNPGLELKLKVPPTSPSHSCGNPYEFINFAIKSQVFDKISKEYHITFTWNNPPANVDSFKVLILQQRHPWPPVALSEDVIDADQSPLHVYTHTVNLKPDACFEIVVQPIYDKLGFTSSSDTLCTAPCLPGPPANVTTNSTSDSVTVRWQNPTYIHPDCAVLEFMLNWAVSTTDLDANNASSVGTVFLLPNATEYTVRGLLPNHLYHFQVTAVTLAGNSTFVRVGQRTTDRQSQSSPDKDSLAVGSIAGPVAAVFALAVVISGIFIARRQRHKYRHLCRLELDSFHPPHLPAIGFDGTKPDQWEVEPCNLNIMDVLGEGFFGVVVKGEVYHNGPPATATTLRPLGILSQGQRKKKVRHAKMEMTVVACKMLKESGTIEDQQELVNEIQLMKKIGHHRHIVSMLGCITRRHPVCLIVEYCQHGDLLRYLRNSRPSWLLAAKKQDLKRNDNGNATRAGNLHNEDYVPMAALLPVTPEKGAEEVVEMEEPAVSPKLSSMDLLLFAKQIALGMDYLAEKKLVHRDLACRNVLVAEDNILKVSDFGLTRAIYKEVAYTQKSKGRLPLKWMAVESIADRVFTTQSDIWSFGIVLWEICTFGGFPYPTIPIEHLLKKLNENYRMERPENCSEELYSIMLQCWHPDPETRPSFSSLVTVVDRLTTTETADLHVDLNFDTHDQYWLSVSELGDSDSDGEPEVPFQEINMHLQQILYVKSLSTMGMEKQCVEEEISSDHLPGLEHSSNKVCHSHSDRKPLQNGHSSPVTNGVGVHSGVGNGSVAMNGHPVTAGRYNINLEYVTTL